MNECKTKLNDHYYAHSSQKELNMLFFLARIAVGVFAVSTRKAVGVGVKVKAAAAVAVIRTVEISF